jgi:hypothetical protein
MKFSLQIIELLLEKLQLQSNQSWILTLMTGHFGQAPYQVMASLFSSPFCDLDVATFGYRPLHLILLLIMNTLTPAKTFTGNPSFMTCAIACGL